MYSISVNVRACDMFKVPTPILSEKSVYRNRFIFFLIIIINIPENRYLNGLFHSRAENNNGKYLRLYIYTRVNIAFYDKPLPLEPINFLNTFFQCYKHFGIVLKFQYMIIIEANSIFTYLS